MTSKQPCDLHPDVRHSFTRYLDYLPSGYGAEVVFLEHSDQVRPCIKKAEISVIEIFFLLRFSFPFLINKSYLVTQ